MEFYSLGDIPVDDMDEGIISLQFYVGNMQGKKLDIGWRHCWMKFALSLWANERRYYSFLNRFVIFFRGFCYLISWVTCLLVTWNLQIVSHKELWLVSFFIYSIFNLFYSVFDMGFLKFTIIFMFACLGILGMRKKCVLKGMKKCNKNVLIPRGNELLLLWRKNVSEFLLKFHLNLSAFLNSIIQRNSEKNQINSE